MTVSISPCFPWTCRAASVHALTSSCLLVHILCSSPPVPAASLRFSCSRSQAFHRRGSVERKLHLFAPSKAVRTSAELFCGDCPRCWERQGLPPEPEQGSRVAGCLSGIPLPTGESRNCRMRYYFWSKMKTCLGADPPTMTVARIPLPAGLTRG